MRRTLQVGAIGLFIIALAVAFDRTRGKPAPMPQRRLLILASESPQAVAEQSPSTADSHEVVKATTIAPNGDVLSERQAALKLILEDFRSEQERAAQRGQSVDHELTTATAKLFIQISQDQSLEKVVTLLAEMTEQQAANVLTQIALTDANLAESLTAKLAARKPNAVTQ